MTHNQAEGIGEVTWEVQSSRERVNFALNNDSMILAVVGTDSFQLQDIPTMDKEANWLRSLPVIQPGIATVQRAPIWKPRTDPNAWSGIVSTHPEIAYEAIRALSERYANPSIEFGSEAQVNEYSNLLPFGWIGARNKNNFELMLKAATHDPKLPLGIKNGLDGGIDHTLSQIERLRDERDSDAAEVVLIYRGGENAKTPDEWEKRYVEAFDATDGKLIVDSAHGGEMAHDPNRDYAKTRLGQITCLKHIMDLTHGGLMPAGVMIEASSIRSQIDPNISFNIAYEAISKLAKKASR